ncbi:anthranilate phosphoribosyltransferase, partial [Candidatus Bipolaricaulota bacterium]|nr:anthranilate phosphoribosyltransferase [Candidatus Bipolaricaulota bacterium]
MKEALASLAEGRHLGEELAAAAMHEVMAGRATQAQIGAFLMGLATKGETAEDLAAMARVMRDHALR